MTITFEPVHESHFPLLLKWLETPHVKKWWDQDVRNTMDLVKSSSVAFSYDPDSSFDEKISSALRYQCEDLNGIKTDFEQVNVYLKHKDANIAGAICYIHGEILWCDSIYVVETFQNKGFGRQLIAKLFDIAITRNLPEVQLNTYFPKAHIFFKKCGFEEVAVIPDWKYDLTCYLMRKII